MKDRPLHHFKSDPNCTLFVGRLSFDTVESALKKHFEEYGDLASVTIIRNRGNWLLSVDRSNAQLYCLVTGLSQGYGFITYTSYKDAKIAYKNAHKSTLDACVILVDFERDRVMKDWIPRRLGGGFGGKKESGQLRFGARDRPFKQPTSSHVRIPYEQKFSDNWTNHHTEEKPKRHRSPSSSQRQRESSKRHRSRSPTDSRSRHQKSRRSPSNDSYPHRYRTDSSSHKYRIDNRYRSYRHERNREKSPGRK